MTVDHRFNRERVDLAEIVVHENIANPADPGDIGIVSLALFGQELSGL